MKIKPHWKNYLLFAPAALLLLSATGGFLYEYWMVGVIADPAKIAGYNFGAESAKTSGGDTFETAGDYATACLAAAIVAFTGLVISSLVVVKESYQPVFKAWGCVLATILLMRLASLIFT